MTNVAASRIARNTAWFTVGSILQKGISFLYFSVIAMAYGVGGTGKYFFALTFTALFAVLADWGISAVLTREIARDRTAGSALIIPAFTLKVAFAMCTGGLITLAAALLGYSTETRAMIAMATLVLVMDSMHIGGYAVLRGLQRVHYEAIGLVVGQSVLTASGVLLLVILGGLHRVHGGAHPLALAHPLPPIWLLVPYLLTSATNISIAAMGWLRERIHPLTAARAGVVRWLLRTASPFAIAGMLARVYTYSDTFLLSILASEAAVGYYSTPFKITFAFQFIPLAFMGALYPAMSAASRQSSGELRTLYEQAMRVLALIALPIAVGIAFLADRIIPTLYGAAFAPSVVPLIILIAALPFIFANYPAGNLLNATDHQSWNTALTAAATAVNLIANFAFIPMIGATGAALSALIGSAVLAIANAVVVHRVVRYRVAVVGSAIGRTLLACACLAVVARLAIRRFPLPVAVLAGAIAYAAAAWGLRVIARDDLRTLRSAFTRRVVVPEIPAV